MVTKTTGSTLTFEEAKTLLVKYGYAKKDMLSSEIIVAMFKQEDFDVTVEDTDEDAKFFIAENYAIKDFAKPIHIHTTAHTTSPYLIGGVEFNNLMTNYQKEKFNLELWCYLARIPTDNSEIFDLNAFTEFYFSDKSETQVAILFDQLVLLGYLVETEDSIEFYVDKQTVNYRTKKHPGVRYAAIEK